MKKNTKKILFAFILISVLLPTVTTHAASLYWKDPSVEAQKNAPFETTLYMDTQDESINAVEGTVTFPSGVLSLSEIRDGNSVINFWIEKPVLADAKIGAFRFSGIIPGGLAAHDAKLLTLVFSAKDEEGGATVALADAHAYHNDSTASEASVTTSAFSALINAGANPAPLPAVPSDTEMPETFVPEIGTDASLFEGKHFVVFDTVDKGTGIDRYEVLETKMRLSWLALFSSWQPAASPYLLADQTGESYIFIKAIDRNGNERVERIAPANPRAWYNDPNTYVIAVLILIFATVLWLGYMRSASFLKKYFSHDAHE
jgi:hypothetical protein